MKDLLDKFFSLVQFSLDPQKKITLQFTEEEWQQLFDIAQQQTLLGVLFRGIQKMDLQQRPPKQLLFQWYLSAERIKAENEKLNHLAIEVQHHFTECGYRSCVLKGQGIATLYPDPSARTCGDIDLLLDGNREEVVAWVRSKYPDAEVLYHHVDYPCSEEVEVEAHVTPSWMFSYFTNRRLQRFFKSNYSSIFQHFVPLPGEDEQLCVPTLAFNRVYILVHIYRHLFGEGIGLRQLMDYYYVLRQGFTEEERLATLKVLEELKMLTFVQSVMYVMREVFGLERQYMLTEVDEKRGPFLLQEVLKAGNFGKFDVRNTRTAEDSLFSLFYKRTKRNLRFVNYYPSEVIWCPLFKIWHLCWRKYHGWV